MYPQLPRAFGELLTVGGPATQSDTKVSNQPRSPFADVSRALTSARDARDCQCDASYFRAILLNRPPEGR